jgi:hypothetical protein
MSGLRLSPRLAVEVWPIRLRRAKALCIGALAGGLLIAGIGPGVSPAGAAPTSMVGLGQASTYAVLSGASVANTVSAPGAPHTTLRGDLGVKANAPPTGFPPGLVTGAVNVGNAAAAQAHADLVTAYTEVAARTGGDPLAGTLVGATITPGLHTIAGAVSNTGTVTLDAEGDPDAVFVFQVGGAMAMAAGSHVVLTNGARASRVFWQVNGAAAIGANADFAGTLMALDAVAVGNGSVVNGRAFARNGALTLDADQVYSAPPVVTITGGAAAYTTDTTPTISGTTDVEAPGIVTVTINGQALSATPSDGAWSVTSPILANATYPVVASVVDAAGNLGSAEQQLTVDTVLPLVTIDGGPSVTTNDPTPTLTGTSDVAPGTVVRVGIGTQSRTALVQADGTWNVTPSALTDGTRDVTASVTDPAGNDGTAGQVLIVDTTPPPVTITGGAHALTNDATPAISGTADVVPGTTVTVTLADETLTAQVDGGGAWSVTASALSDGPHRAVVSVSDAAGNAAGATQILTVDTVSPAVAINGGAQATTSDFDPTISGTSDAAPGTIVTVSIAGQTLMTLVQADGTWNTTPSVVGVGTWLVVAAVTDPAGNLGSAGQALTIALAGAAPLPDLVSPPAAPVPGRPAAPDAVLATTVTGSARQKVKSSSLSIATKVTAATAGGVVATATGVVNIAGLRKAIGLTRVVAKLAAGRSATLRQRPIGASKVATAACRTISRAARAGKKVTATITVRVSDAAGHSRDVKRAVKLTAQRRRPVRRREPSDLGPPRVSPLRSAREAGS